MLLAVCLHDVADERDIGNALPLDERNLPDAVLRHESEQLSRIGPRGGRYGSVVNNVRCGGVEIEARK